MIYTILNIVLVMIIVGGILGLIMGWIITKIFKLLKIIVRELKEC